MGFWFPMTLLLAVISAKKPENRYTVYACEGQELEITCEKGRVISLIRANYGRFSISICNEHGSLDWSVDCASPLSYLIIYGRCNHMAHCVLGASSDTFEDPCPGTFKYLEVQYDCILESMTKMTLSSSTTTTTSTTSTPRPPVIIPITRSVKPTVSTEAYTQRSALRTSSSTLIPKISPVAKTSLNFNASEILSSTMPISGLGIIRTTTVIFKKDDYCPQVHSRNLTWEWTRAGKHVVQRCPGGTFGEARWYCGLNPVRWVPDSADLSECSSLWAENLKSRVDDGDSVVNIATELSVMTHRKPLFGGDVRHAIDILQRILENMTVKMKEVGDDKQRHQLLQELLYCAGDVSSNLFASASWKEFALKDRKHLASTLIEALEHSSWLLASVHKSAFYFKKVLNNIFLSVQVLETEHVSQLIFPSADEVLGTSWEETEDSINLPIQAVSGTANGIIKLVFASYNHVGEFLGTAANSHGNILHNSSRIINSLIISASVDTLTGIKFSEPVVITFKLIQEENVTNPQCVYWNMDLRLWSLDGCWLRKANLTHAICECDHLTNFALLMDIKNGSNTVKEDNFLSKVIVFSSCIISMLLFVITIFLLQVFRSYPNDHALIHQHLCVCLLIAEIVYIASVDQIDVICFILSGILHFILQAVFLWLFLSTLQLYLMLEERNPISRARFYSLVAYGFPLLIVAIAAIIDPKSYGTVNYCFLRFDNYYVFCFVGPAFSCIFGAVVFLVLIIFKTCWFSFKNKEESKISFIKLHNRQATIVVLVSGSCWSFLLLYIKENVRALAFVFSALNVLQGLAVFLCFGLNNNELKQAYHKWRNGSCAQPKTIGHQFPLTVSSSSHVEPQCLQHSTLSSLSNGHLFMTNENNLSHD